MSEGTAVDKHPIANWWATVDRPIVVTVLILMAIGIVVGLASSTAMAVKLGRDELYFFRLHGIWLALGLGVFTAASVLTDRQIRRVSLILLILSITLMALAILLGDEVKGARRWLHFSGWSLQPSEFAKPSFVILVAWFFSEAVSRPKMPAKILSFSLYAVVVSLLLLQPDVGQAILITLVWGALFFLAGASIFRLAALGFVTVTGLAISYFAFPHVKERIDAFLSGPSGGTSQSGRAIQSFEQGGWFGRGPGEGDVKQFLPDAHTDFPFAVLGEEFGILACLLVAALYAFLVVRIVLIAARQESGFANFAASGLGILVGFQASINMAVSVGLLPPKGMTLPFISYGGSSFLALCLATGFIVALTRSGRTKIPRTGARSNTAQ